MSYALRSVHSGLLSGIYLFTSVQLHHIYFSAVSCVNISESKWIESLHGIQAPIQITRNGSHVQLKISSPWAVSSGQSGHFLALKYRHFDVACYWQRNIICNWTDLVTMEHALTGFFDQNATYELCLYRFQLSAKDGTQRIITAYTVPFAVSTYSNGKGKCNVAMSTLEG